LFSFFVFSDCLMIYAKQAFGEGRAGSIGVYIRDMKMVDRLERCLKTLEVDERDTHLPYIHKCL